MRFIIQLSCFQAKQLKLFIFVLFLGLTKSRLVELWPALVPMCTTKELFLSLLKMN
jgi:hypothetical protein